MSLFTAFEISGSALTAEKLRLEVIAGNLANMQTTRTPEGGPYRRRTVVFAEALAAQRTRGANQKGGAFPGRGVRVERIYADRGEPQLVYDPEHPDAGADGYVRYPNIELAREMTDMITALRSYEANATAVNTAKSLYLKALEIGR
ncbi:MAG: flagellar basal body rod protein FlgC [Firmicutes bacterium]|nr:flagellar basal body rod protein FlgC [Bacillota bacterium]